jgi:hypothetical protein
MPRRQPKSAVRRERGFALLITITLLAFLVLLLVSLASLTRVETQVASNNQQLAQARQNALMALNIAIGQLQKYAGPDQRTTARADLENGAGIVNSQWIGVYGSSVKGDYAATPETIAPDLSTSANLTGTGSPARLLNWLVSGNENTNFNPVWTSGDVGSKGQITDYPDPASATAIAFKPPGTVTGLTSTTQSTDTSLTITNAAGTSKPARLLVGANSVTSALDASGKPVDYVVAPAVDIAAADNTVPGTSGAPTVGRYAWWIGDEGMKARVNLPLAGTDTSLSASARLEQQRNAFSNSNRAAIELMSRNTPGWAPSLPALTAPRIDTLYAPTQIVATILTPGQTALASPNPSAISPALKYHFHDLTAVSSTVLADSYAGGLKRDLSILLDSSYTPSAADPTANANRLWVPHAGDDGMTGSFKAGFEIPTWKHLRSYYQTRIPTSGTDKLTLSPRLPANDKSGVADDVGVGPVITYFSVGFRVAPAGIPAAGVEIHMNFYPLVVIWNPYNFTLKAPAKVNGSNYEVGIYPTYNVQVRLEKIIAGTPSTVASFDFQKSTAGSVTDTEFLRFGLDCPDIPPGQSLIFSLPHTSSGQVYNQRNILQNIEPEPSAYVSVPFRDNSGTNIVIQAGEAGLDYQLNKIVSGGTNFSSSFSNGGGGLMYTYLGAPDTASRVVVGGAPFTPASNRLGFNPSNPARSWYNTHQSIGWDANVATTPIQGPEPLVYDTATSEPSYVYLTQALFSGQGNNAQLDANQFMFTTRWLAQGNMRATRSGRTRRDNNYNVLFTATTGSPSIKVLWQKFINNSGADSNRTSAGQGHDWINGSPVDVSLFEFPYDNQPLQSIGQLQHANLSLIGDYPSYPVGNSLGDFRLHGLGGSKFSTAQPAGWQLARVDTASGASLTELGTDMKGYYDISYLLNRTLWDRYYFSTVPATGAVPSTLPNPRHVVLDSTVNLQDPDRSASALALAGGFNINSTSEQAWRAILGGGNQLIFDPENPDSASTHILKASFPRLTRPNGDTDLNDAWRGYRELDEAQIAQLARNIVDEIRSRGPFISLADFVNRRLVDNAATTVEDETFRGTIQAAIDNTTASTSIDRGEFPANDGTGSFWSQDPLITTAGADRINQSSQYTDGYYSRAQVEGRLNATVTAAKPYGNRSAFAPKYITQADILAKIGAGLAGRSDTFSIRTYGEAINPITQDINGRAWCEAIVQRLPEYIEPKSGSSGNTPEDAVSSLSSTNQTFGRKFKIVSFRWLSSNDI